MSSFNVTFFNKEVGSIFLLKVGIAFFIFIYTFFLTKFIGAEGIGVFQTALSIILPASIIAGLGFKNAVLRLVSSKIAIKDYISAKLIYRSAIFYSGLTAIFATIFLQIFLDSFFLLFFPLKKELITPILIMSFAIFPLTLCNLLAELLKAFKKFKLSVLAQNGFTYSLSILSLCFFFFYCGQITILQAVLLFTVSAWLSFFIGFFYFQKYRTKYSLKSDMPKKWFKNLRQKKTELFVSSMPLWVVSINTIIMQYLDVVLIGIWIGHKEAGIYFIAKKVALLNSFLLASMNTVIAPKFAALYALNQLEDLKELVQKSTRTLFWVGLITFIFFSTFSKVILGIFGNDFIEGWYLLIILSLGQFVNIAMGAVGYLLIMTGNETFFRDNMILSGVLTIILYLVFIPNFSVLGIAMAVVLGGIFQNCRGAWLVRRQLGFYTLKFEQ